MVDNRHLVFNSALETGTRATAILLASFPRTIDLQRLVTFDYLVVHSEDVGGPESLHPPLPLRAGELLVRRKLVEASLQLMMSRGIIVRHAVAEGIYYQAGERAAVFLDSVVSRYIEELRMRAVWVISEFEDNPEEQLGALVRGLFDQWSSEFYSIEKPASKLEMFQ